MRGDSWYVTLPVSDVVYMNATYHTLSDARGFFTHILHPENCSATDIQHYDTYRTFRDSARFIGYL